MLKEHRVGRAFARTTSLHGPRHVGDPTVTMRTSWQDGGCGAKPSDSGTSRGAR